MVKVKVLKTEDEICILQTVIEHIEKFGFSCSEDVHQRDDGQIYAVDMLGDIVDYLDRHHLIEKSED